MVSGPTEGAQISRGELYVRKVTLENLPEVQNNPQLYFKRYHYHRIQVCLFKQYCGNKFSIKRLFQDPHLQYGLPPMGQPGMKRSAEGAGLDMMEPPSSDEDSSEQKPQIHSPHHDQYEDHEGWEQYFLKLVSQRLSTFFRSYPPGAGRGKSNGPPTPHNGKKTKGRVRKTKMCVSTSIDNNPRKVKIKMEFIDNKLRRYTTFSKRKTGIMKKVCFCVQWVLGQRYLSQTNSLFVDLSSLLWYFMDSQGGQYNFRLQITSKLVTIGQIFHSSGPSV